MPDYCLAAYTVRVRERMAPKTSANYLRLDDFDGQGSDVVVFLYALCKSLADRPFQHRMEGKYLVGEAVRAKDRTVYAIIRSGSHGYQATLRDVDTHEDTHERQPNEAELIPLRNCFVIPRGASIGIFLTERVGVRGLKSSLDLILGKSFTITHPGYALDLNPLAPEAAVKASLEEGELKKIRLVRYGIPSDIADRYNLGAHEEELGIMELVLKPDRLVSFPKRRVREALNDNSLPALLEVRGLEYHDIKLEVKVGRSMRTLTVTQERPPRVTFPIPENDNSTSGRPTDQSVYTVAAEVVDELAPDLALTKATYLNTGFVWNQALRAKRVEIPDDEG